MPRVDLRDVVPAGVISDRSKSDVLRQLSLTTIPALGTNTGESGAAGSAARLQASMSDLLNGPTSDFTGQISGLMSQIANLNSTQQTQIGATQDNTQALVQSSTGKAGGASAMSIFGNVASTLLGGNFGLSPIVSGLLSLFGGGSGAGNLVAQLPFKLPPPVQLDAGLSGGGGGQAVPVSYAAGGQARGQTVSPAPQISVQVNAIDSRSFLDHSDDIARAVRQAMLNSNALNDVISDL